MSDEIKEKDIIQKSVECLANAKLNDTSYEVARDIVLDYITNLQEENKEFKARWKDTNVIIKDNKTLVMNTNAYNCLEDYKSRCEKAIEWVKKNMYYFPRPYELLNILNGEMDE